MHLPRYSDWKITVAFSLCGDMRERRCPWRVPDGDCCLHKAAKWPCLPHLVQVWRCAGQLPERSSLLLPRPTWPQYVSARRSKQQGCGWSLLLEHSPLLFSKRTDRSRCIGSPVKLQQGKFTRFFAFDECHTLFGRCVMSLFNQAIGFYIVTGAAQNNLI